MVPSPLRCLVHAASGAAAQALPAGFGRGARPDRRILPRDRHERTRSAERSAA